MALSNAQHDAVEFVYQERRREAREAARARREAAYEAVPQLAALDEERRRLGLARLRGRLGGAETDPETAARLARIDAEKAERLTAAGISPESFEPVWRCPLCRDTGFADGAECECRRRLVRELFYSASPLWQRVSREDFAHFSLEWYDDEKPLPQFGGLTARAVMADNLAQAKAYAADFAEKKGNLLMMGPVGTGKTFLCNAIAGAVLAAGGSVLYMTAKEYFDAEAALAFGREDRDEGLAEELKRAELLIIDDLGTEFTPRTLARSVLFTMVNERALAGLGTVISTNDSLGELEEKYGARTASRLRESYRILYFTGPDIRTARRSADSL